MSDTRPIPYPADTRAKGWRFGFDLERIERLDSWALAKDGLEHGVILMMLMAAWPQEPCATLPADDSEIAGLAGVKLKRFIARRHVFMRDWYLAVDGRYYHPVLTLQVLEMLDSRAHGWLKHRAEVLERDGYRCTYCGDMSAHLTLDHIHPRSRGGSDDPSNLTPACRPCNSSKGAKLLSEWRRS